MPICGCSSGQVAAVLVALLALPAPYLMPELTTEPPPLPQRSALEHFLEQCPPSDLCATLVLLLLIFAIYLCEWIQRKLLEIRIAKLKQHLVGSVAQLQARDNKQEQLEATLRRVQAATHEYNLLLYLLLRQRRAATIPPPNCFIDNNGLDELSLSPTAEA